MSLGERIRTARERAGLSREQLAEQLGVDPSTVRNWENSTSERPRNRAKVTAWLDAQEQPQPDRWAQVSDWDLVKAVADRLDQLRRELAAASGPSTGDQHQDALLNAIAEADARRGVTEEMRNDALHPATPPIRGRKTRRNP
jgi:transcriptional regulator with XRE-family HTH domain